MHPPEILARLDRAAAGLVLIPPWMIAPGVSNLGEAAARALEVGDVAALAGGLVVTDGRVRPAGPAAYGADPALARAVLTVMRLEQGVRAAVSILPLPGLARQLDEHLHEVAVVDPRRAPPGISSMDWAIAQASSDGVPDAVLVEGRALLLFAGTADEVADEIIKLSSYASI